LTTFFAAGLGAGLAGADAGVGMGAGVDIGAGVGAGAGVEGAGVGAGTGVEGAGVVGVGVIGSSKIRIESQSLLARTVGRTHSTSFLNLR
jgi:hypothetical protein